MNPKVRPSLVDPSEFARKWLRSDVWSTEAKILDSIASKPRTAVKACHSSGKTFTAALAALWFLARWPEAIVVTTAPTHQQVEKLLWGEIHSALGRSRYPFPKATLTELRIGPKRYAIGFTTNVTQQNEGVRFQGFHADHILMILDEAPGVDPKIWQAIEGARAGGKVSILALGNPTISSGSFYDAFHGGRAGWNLFTLSAFDTPNLDGLFLEFEADGKAVRLGNGDRDLLSLTEDELDENARPYLTTRRWVKEKFLEWGPDNPLWESRVLGNFPTQSEDALLSLAWLEAAKASDKQFEGKLVAGLDVAGPGEDETVLTVRCGGQILFHKAWADADPRGKVVAALNSFGRGSFEAVNVDSAGIGWGMYQHLKDLKFPAVPINVGESPRDSEKYANLKAELFWGLRMRFAAGDASGLLDEAAIGQLAGIRYRHNARGQVQIESKEDARKRGVKSPDRAESIMLAFAQRNTTYGLLEAMKRLASGTATLPHISKPQVSEKESVDVPADQCEVCQGTFIQKLSVGYRCGNCGHQFGAPPIEIYDSQRLPPARNAWRM
jgi:phage terminase large subunit